GERRRLRGRMANMKERLATRSAERKGSRRSLHRMVRHGAWLRLQASDSGLLHRWAHDCDERLRVSTGLLSQWKLCSRSAIVRAREDVNSYFLWVARRLRVRFCWRKA